MSRCTKVEIVRVGGLSDQQVHVVGLAVELAQLDIELGTHATHDVLGSNDMRWRARW